MKTCTKCNQQLPLDRFAWVNQERGWRRNVCRSCKSKPAPPERRREYHLLKKYGLSNEDYAEMEKAQGYACAGCGTTEPTGKYGKLHVDHNHETGEVRGLLCYNCNSALGLLGDNISTLESLIRYLR